MSTSSLYKDETLEVISEAHGASPVGPCLFNCIYKGNKLWMSILDVKQIIKINEGELNALNFTDAGGYIHSRSVLSDYLMNNQFVDIRTKAGIGYLVYLEGQKYVMGCHEIIPLLTSLNLWIPTEIMSDMEKQWNKMKDDKVLNYIGDIYIQPIKFIPRGSDKYWINLEGVESEGINCLDLMSVYSQYGIDPNKMKLYETIFVGHPPEEDIKKADNRLEADIELNTIKHSDLFPKTHLELVRDRSTTTKSSKKVGIVKHGRKDLIGKTVTITPAGSQSSGLRRDKRRKPKSQVKKTSFMESFDTSGIGSAKGSMINAMNDLMSSSCMEIHEKARNDARNKTLSSKSTRDVKETGDDTSRKVLNSLPLDKRHEFTPEEMKNVKEETQSDAERKAPKIVEFRVFDDTEVDPLILILDNLMLFVENNIKQGIMLEKSFETLKAFLKRNLVNLWNIIHFTDDLSDSSNNVEHWEPKLSWFITKGVDIIDEYSHLYGNDKFKDYVIPRSVLIKDDIQPELPPMSVEETIAMNNWIEENSEWNLLQKANLDSNVEGSRTDKPSVPRDKPGAAQDSNVSSKPLPKFHVGQIVGVRDKDRHWWMARVLYIFKDPKYPYPWYYIHYEGWNNIQREWICSPDRIKWFNPRRDFLKKS